MQKLTKIICKYILTEIRKSQTDVKSPDFSVDYESGLLKMLITPFDVF